MTPTRMIALFVKPPIPGLVKTRLAKDIGNVAACKVYRNLAESIIAQIKASGVQMVLFYDGGEVEKLPESWKKSAMKSVAQIGEDLGIRMVNAFRSLFDDGVEQLVLIGSDIYGIDAAYLKQAFELLMTKDMVISPAFDGGYCLVGFNKASFDPSLFCGIPWSTERVFELTMESANTSCLSAGILKPLRDIDRLDDLLAMSFSANLEALRE